MIYLDYAAATPLDPKVQKAMLPYFSDAFFNPSAIYLPANAVRRAYTQAKANIAHIIGAKGTDLVITAGATESINLAFTAADPRGTVLISGVEHSAVLENAKRFKTYQVLKVDQDGVVDLADFEAKLSSQVTFVSVCAASSELGSIEPIAKIGQLIKAERARRAHSKNALPLFFHCDASQGLGLIDLKINRLGVDLLTLNAGKVYGPKGIGALYVGHRVPVHALILGGGQENALRSGTENVPAVIGFAKAVQLAEKHRAQNLKHFRLLKTNFRALWADFPGVVFLGNPKAQLSNFSPLAFPGLDAERLIFALEEQGIYFSTGAACAARKGKASSTLLATGLADEIITGSLRVTFGRATRLEDLRTATLALRQAVLAERARLKAANQLAQTTLLTPTSSRLKQKKLGQKHA